ncbi:MAG TPA: biotin carboxylase N-terminal domain-containing protein, partial [Candidatus Xenobia bacterium]
MRTDWTRLAIVNRGEAAMRLIHAVREYNREHGTGLRTIILYTEPDRHALPVREADEAVFLGPALDPDTRKSTYLDLPRLEAALRQCQAEAVWVGWGFVAENPDFVDLCDRLHIVFLGPPADAMRRLGDKIKAKHLADEAQVPTSAWSRGPVDSLEEALQHAGRIGYPLMLKAAAGGGGRGIRKVYSADDLPEALERSRSEALKAFGDSSVLMERLLEGARHVEVQVICDGQGGAWALGVRDCTLQRRHQKVLEETPAPTLPPERAADLQAAALRLCEKVGYRGAGTVEFLYRPGDDQVAFLEVNTRLQVEHPVTEAIYGVDLVKLQIDVARGKLLSGAPPVPRGHALEVRLCAEDPDNGFAPAPGHVAMFRLPTGPSVRVDSGVAEDTSIPSEFDSMIAKLIAWGRDRTEALARVERALGDFTVLVRGGTTNKGFLLQLLNHPQVISGDYDTGWLDREMAGAVAPALRPHADVAVLVAALDIHDAALARQIVNFQQSAFRLRPEARRETGRGFDLRYGTQAVTVEVLHVGPRAYRLTAGATVMEVSREGLGLHEAWLTYAGRRHRVLSMVHGVTHLVEVDGVPHRMSSEEGGFVRAPSPAVVVSVQVKPGDKVAAGDRVAVLEAMKLESSLTAPVSGVVREVLVMRNTQVAAGAALVRIEPESSGAASSTVVIPFQSSTLPARPADRLRRLLMGYDGESDAKKLLAEWNPAADDPQGIEDDAALLELYVDIHGLQRNSGEGRNLDAWLRKREEVEGSLPPAFLDRLKVALKHYGVESLSRSPRLEESLFWLYRSLAREKVAVGIVLSILERRLQARAALAIQSGTETWAHFRWLLERLMEETRTRNPAVHELAIELRWRAFDKPAWYQATEHLYQEMEGVVDRLLAAPPAEEAALIETLVECPQPLIGSLTRRYHQVDAHQRPRLLEAITRRYYRMRELVPVGVKDDVAAWDYPRGDKMIRLLSTSVRVEAVADALATLGRATAAAPPDYDVVVDLYLLKGSGTETIEESLNAALTATPPPRPWRRLVFVIVAEEPSRSMQKVRHFTYRPTVEGGYAEERSYRGFHPMMTNRIRIVELLKNFDTERQPSTNDMYVYQARAKENPKDERFFVFADVRDVTLMRSPTGALRLPQLERMLHESLSAIRARQMARRPEERTHWNRISLYIWPTLQVTTDDIISVVQRAVPRTAALGLHKIVVDVSLGKGLAGRREIHFTSELSVTVRQPHDQPIRPLSEYKKKVLSLRRRDLVYPYEIVRMLTPSR